MGSDYVYVDSDGKIYEEHEMEEPMFRPSGACNETYTGKQFTEEELNEFLSVNKEEEDRQKEVLSRMGIKFGKQQIRKKGIQFVKKDKVIQEDI